MIKASIIGISGYGGIELFRILRQHKNIEIVNIYSESNKNEIIGKLYPQFSHIDMKCVDKTPEEITKESDVIFTAVPHGGASLPYTLLSKKYNKKIIDLSAEFRLKDPIIYEKWYGNKVEDKELLKEAVYGLPELHKDQIKKSWLIANPGCYTTASILANAPLVKNKVIDLDSIIIDAKSGISGAGKKPRADLHFPELDESFYPYSVTTHRHTPEIEQELTNLLNRKIEITFTPHLVPMVRGIIATSYSKLKDNNITEEKLYTLYRDFYKEAPFVRVIDNIPNTKWVATSNFIDIAIRIDKRTNNVIVISALDNLIKGASGQAIQNMNIMFDEKEDEALTMVGAYP